MNVDDADTLRRFIAQIQGRADRSDPNTVTSSPTPQQDRPAKGHGPTLDTVGSEHADEHDGTTTPPHATVTGQDNHHLASPEAQPKPSPHSGLRAPVNSPKTAASSPRLAAANTHNEDVGEAITKYINALNSSPLSESMWAPKSARYKPSTLSGARSANVLTPIKAVEPNPAINETFDRMSFKAADPDHEASENLIGEHVALSMSTVLPNNTHGAKVDDVVHVKSEKASDETSKPLSQNETVANIQSDQVKPVRVSEEDLTDTAPDEGVGKENTAPSTPNANLPPHLRATRVPSQQSIKAEIKVPSSEEPGPDVTSTIANTSSIKNTQATTVGDEKAMVTTGPARTKVLTDPSPEKEDLEHKAVFNAWPALEERRRPGMYPQFLVCGGCLPKVSRRGTYGHHQRPASRLDSHVRNVTRIRWTHGRYPDSLFRRWEPLGSRSIHERKGLQEILRGNGQRPGLQERCQRA